MNIFFIKIDKFLQHIEKSSITKEFSSQKRCIEYSLGRFLTMFVAKNFYNLENQEIIVNNKKPKFSNSNIHFNISHSKNIVAVAFDNYDIGLDFELIKDRNIEKLSNYLKKDFKSLTEFYQYWTCFEAQYKSKPQNLTSFKFENYMVSVSTFSEIKTKLKIYEVEIPKNKTNPNELINLKEVNDSNKNDNAVEINEINTASLEFLSPLALKIE